MYPKSELLSQPEQACGFMRAASTILEAIGSSRDISDSDVTTGFLLGQNGMHYFPYEFKLQQSLTCLSSRICSSISQIASAFSIIGI